MSIEEILENRLAELINEKAADIPIKDPDPISVPEILDFGLAIDKYKLNLTGGRINSVQTHLQNINTVSEGQEYRVEALTKLGVVFDNWLEKYIKSVGRHVFHHTNTCHNFSFSIEKLVASIEIVIKNPNPASVKTTVDDITFNIPGNSVLSGRVLPCVKNRIHDGISDAIQKFQYSTLIANKLNEILEDKP